MTIADTSHPPTKRSRTMKFALAFAIPLLVAYAAALVLLFVAQRSLLFVPDPRAIPPGEAGLPQAESLRLPTADGEKLVAWFIAPRAARPLLLYFHGNGGHLATRAERFGELTRDGSGLLAIDYRGYGGSTGSPTERGLHLDADAALAEAEARGYPPSRIIVIGESLGTGVAVELASRVRFAGVVLEAAYSSTADVAAARYWMFPVRLLMLDPFRSDLYVEKVRSPMLFVHGTADSVVPFRFGKRLYALAPEPKRFLAVEKADHQPFERPAVMEEVRTWIAARF